MLYFVEEAFNQMALLVDNPIHRARCLAVAARWDHDRYTLCLYGLDQIVAVVALVADERSGALRCPGQQGIGLADIAGLPARALEVQRVTQGIRGGVNLGSKTASRPSQRFGIGRAPRGSRGARMGADDRGVDKNSF